jgi:hypothetical protein
MPLIEDRRAVDQGIMTVRGKAAIKKREVAPDGATGIA